MTMHVVVDSTGRITATSASYPCGDGEFPFDFPDDFDAARQGEYRIESGILVHDPLPAEAPLPTEGERLAALEAAVLELALGGGFSG